MSFLVSFKRTLLITVVNKFFVDLIAVGVLKAECFEHQLRSFSEFI